jgi:hypothetical protein
MKRNFKTGALVGGLLVVALAFWVYWHTIAVDVPDIATPDGWVGTRYKNHFVFTKDTGMSHGEEIVVDVEKMDRPLVAWIDAYIQHVPYVDHIPFDPLQTWTMLNGHLVLVAEEKATASVTWYLFGEHAAYIFYFNRALATTTPAPDVFNSSEIIANTARLQVLQKMVSDFASKLD